MHKKRLFCLFLIFLMQSCHIGRFFIYNFADINDHKKFPSKELKKSHQPFYFIQPTAANYVHLPDSLKQNKRSFKFKEGLERTGTVAFIIIRNDSVLYEWYNKSYNALSIIPSFSIAKSFISVLIGIALDEGLIKSTQEPITRYINYLDSSKFGKITIQHLLDMQSGLKYSEGYFSPFSDVAKYYYGRNIKKYLRHLKIKREPGKQFDYISVNTQLLGLIIEKVTGKTLTHYLQEKLWTPLGMENDASWSIDSKKHQTEKAYCCINARAKDFAKLGRLYLKKGNWDGKQIVSEKWVVESLTFKGPKNDFEYSNQWWHTIKWHKIEDTVNVTRPNQIITVKYKGKAQRYLIYPSGDFMAEGLLGQIVYVNPKRNMIGVRLGKKTGDLEWGYVFRDISEKN